ncbi:MAG: DUF362 domain-containing protein [Verrucomicrobiales bacterium]
MATNRDEIDPDPKGMSRREFVQQALITGSVTLGSIGLAAKLWQRHHVVPGFEEKQGISLPSYRVDGSKVLPDLSVAHSLDRVTAIRAAVDNLGGMDRFIRKGDVVLIKPNIAFDRPPALAATTHPDALRAVAQMALEAGAKEVMVADNPINSPAGCFLKSGLEAVADELNLGLLYPESSAFESIQMEGEILRHWPFFHRPFQKADKVIGLAPCKDHNLCHASMTMKNWYGLLGGRRNQFHQHIHSIISDFALMIQPTLVILDGMDVLMSNGPTGGRLSDVKRVNTVVAGTDMVAIDSYGFTRLLERDVEKLEYLHKAHRRGLGTMDWKDLKLKEVEA